MSLKVLILLGLAALVSAAPKARTALGNNLHRRNMFEDYLYRRENKGGCSDAELKMLEESGVDIEKSNVDCTTFSNNIQKRGCSFVYTATSACCSDACNWLMEFHCMNPSQMICKK